MYKYYLRLNKNNNIIHSFSDAFEQPKENDILYKESTERIFTLNIRTDEGYKYKYENGEIIEVPKQEIVKTYHHNPDNRKAVFMNSGGPDTLTTAILMHKKYELHSFYLDGYLPNRTRAMSMAEKIAKKYCVSHEIMDIGKRAMTEFDYFDPTWESTKTMKKLYPISRYTIPFQPTVFFNLAAVYAVNIGTDIVIAGCDEKVTPMTDLINKCYTEFMKFGAEINFIHALSGYTDEDIIKILENDLELKDYTVSCDYEIPCHGCWKCKRRENSLKFEEKVYAQVLSKIE